MRIFALSTWFPYPTTNGSTLRVYHLLRALASAHDVDLAAFTPLCAPAPEDIDHLRSFCRSVTPIAHSPFASHRLPRARLLSSVPRSLAESYQPEVHDLARRASAAVDLSIGFQLGAAWYLDNGAGRPTIFEEAEPTQIESLWRTQPSAAARARARLTWWKHALFLRRLMRQMNAVTVVSEAERARLVDIGGDPSAIHIVPNGVERADLERPRRSGRPRIVYAGSVTYRPNLDAVTWFHRDILPAVKAERPDVEFWVTGATTGVATGDLPNANWAHFTGQLPDVKDVVGDAAVAIAPIRAGGGTRLKILEALALGVPVVTTRKGAEGLDVADGDQVLLADTPDLFARAVLRVLDDETLARRLSAGGRARAAERYAWPAIGDRLNALVLEVMDRWPQLAR